MKSSTFKAYSAPALGDHTRHHHFITGQRKKDDMNTVSCAEELFFSGGGGGGDGCDTSERRGIQSVMRPLPALASEQPGPNHHWLSPLVTLSSRWLSVVVSSFQLRHRRVFVCPQQQQEQTGSTSGWRAPPGRGVMQFGPFYCTVEDTRVIRDGIKLIF